MVRLVVLALPRRQLLILGRSVFATSPRLLSLRISVGVVSDEIVRILIQHLELIMGLVDQQRILRAALVKCLSYLRITDLVVLRISQNIRSLVRIRL